MSKLKTPLLKALRLSDSNTSGGTLYVFPSAAEDIGLNLNSTVNGVALSHYALLNIPDMTIDQLINVPGCSLKLEGTEDNISNDSKGFARALTLSLLNYMMNFETRLINDDDYNFQELHTVTEKVFWHWAKSIGILTAADTEYKTVEGYNNIYKDARFNNDLDYNQTDDTLIKCFGSIDAGNSLSTEFGIFNETYINIPTSYGAGPVYLCSSFNKNYKRLQYPIDDITHLEGRNIISQNNSYMSYLGYDKPYYDTADRKYNTDDDFDGLEIVKDLTLLEQIIHKDNDGKNENLSITSYDDINVDINNKLGADIEFEFNAILLYYSVYDLKDLKKESYATNLFGIIFLDGPRAGETDKFYIPRHKKAKSTSERFGNSYSFRVNIKTMSVYDNTDAVIQDNTTMSSIISNDFSDAISLLNRAVDIMNTNMHTTAAIQNRYAAIVSYYDNQKLDIEDLSTKLNAYIHGEHSSIMDTSLLYVNDIKPNEDNEQNNIEFFVRSDNDEYGNTLYTDALLTIDSSGVTIPKVFVSEDYHKKSYIVEDNTTKLDLNLSGNDNNDIDLDNKDIENANTVLDLMFKSTDNLNIKIKHDTDYSINNAIHHEKVYNQLYIDPDSSIFNLNKDDKVGYLKTVIGEDSYISYESLIPFIIAQLQRMSNTEFGYTYDPNNNIYTLDDVKTIQDAITLLLNDKFDNNSGDDTEKMLPMVGNVYVSVYKKTATGELDPDTDINDIYQGMDIVIKINYNFTDINAPADSLLNINNILMKYTNNNATTYEIMKEDGTINEPVNGISFGEITKISDDGHLTYYSTEKAEPNITDLAGITIDTFIGLVDKIEVDITAKSAYKNKWNQKTPDKTLTNIMTFVPKDLIFYWMIKTIDNEDLYEDKADLKDYDLQLSSKDEIRLFNIKDLFNSEFKERLSEYFNDNDKSYFITSSTGKNEISLKISETNIFNYNPSTDTDDANAYMYFLIPSNMPTFILLSSTDKEPTPFIYGLSKELALNLKCIYSEPISIKQYDNNIEYKLWRTAGPVQVSNLHEVKLYKN